MARGKHSTAESTDLIERDRRVVWHPYTQHATEAPPLPVAEALGSLLTLEDGRQIIDGISSWWACLHGHRHPTLLEAFAAQARRLDHVLFAGATHEPAVGLAEDLLQVVPTGLTRVFYSDNGSTAVEVALKIAYQQWVHRGEPDRLCFLCFEGAYHGDTFGAMSVGDPDPFFEPFAPLLFRARRVIVDADAVADALADLDGQAAGVLVEPLLQGAGGMRMHPPQLLRDLRSICDQFGVPLIADEVLTGFGRTGSLFACDQADVSPDLLCLAKGLTGGMLPLAATLATEELFAAFLSESRARALFHGHTHTANPLTCAVARASLQLCLEEDVPLALNKIGQQIVQGLQPLQGLPHVSQIRQLGGVVAFDLNPPAGDAPGYLAKLGPDLRRAAIRRGVLLRPLGNVLYAMPPACTDTKQCDIIAQVMVELATATEP